MLFGMKRPTDPDHRLLHGAADPTRLAILRQLAAGDAAVCACDFTACCEVAQPTVSHHLKVLRESGWVRAERRASFVYYHLRPEAVARFQQLAGQLGPTMNSTRALPRRPAQRLNLASWAAVWANRHLPAAASAPVGEVGFEPTRRLRGTSS